MNDPLDLLSEKNRLETFNRKWKPLKGFKHCTPEKFAAAGFYNPTSKSSPDIVKCFVCGKELGDWEKDDDPWEEHKKRGEQCKFVEIKSKSMITFKDLIELYFEVKRNDIIECYGDHLTLLNDEQDKIKKLFRMLKRRK